MLGTTECLVGLIPLIILIFFVTRSRSSVDTRAGSPADSEEHFPQMRALLEKFEEEDKEEEIPLAEKVPEVEESPMEKLEKLIERRNVGEVTAEEFEETKKEILERRPQVSKDLIEIAQEGVHSDDVPRKKDKDSVINKSEDGAGSFKMQELRDLTGMKDRGLIDDAEFKQMKKEILGK